MMTLPVPNRRARLPITSPSGLVYAGLEVAGLAAVARRFRNAGVILCYHNVESPSAPPEARASGLHIPVDLFRQQMRWLVARYEVLPFGAFLDRLATGRPMRRTASVTFDDAYAGVFEYALPVLRDFGIPATVFVVTGAPARGAPFWWDRGAVLRAMAEDRRHRWLTELRGDGEAILGSLGLPVEGEAESPARRPASWSVLAAAAKSGIELGVHSSTHRTLPTLGDDELVDEIETSRLVLAREAGVTPTVFAFPYGSWDERVRDRVRRAGYRAALTLDYGLVRTGKDPWSLPRVNVPSAIRHPAFHSWVAGLNLRHLLQ